MKLKLNNSTYKALSNLCNSVAQICYAAIIAASVLPIDFGQSIAVILQLIYGLLFWFLSVKFAEKGKL